MAPTKRTVKILSALSGNCCAFPNCKNKLFDSANYTTIGEICHIKGDKPGSPRHDPNQSDKERHGIGNLILLCPLHHTVVDSDPESYSVDRLVEMKKKHEEQFSESQSANEYVVDRLIAKWAMYDYSININEMNGGTVGHTFIDAPHATFNLSSHTGISRPKNVLAHSESIWFAPSTDTDAPLTEVKVDSRDINQKIVRIPEFEESEFKEVVEEMGYEFNEFDGQMSFVFEEKVTNDNLYVVEEKLDQLRNRLKGKQLDKIEGMRDSIVVKSEIIGILSSAISRANKKIEIDRGMAFLFLKNLLGSLVDRGIENIKFLDDDEITKLVDASLSDAPEDVKKNLDGAFRDIIVKIRKLFLVFSYDQLSIRIINYHAKPEELSKIAENNYISISGDKLKVFRVPAYGKKYYVGVDQVYGDIVTFGLGKKRRSEIDPIIHMLFVDRISFYIRQEFLAIMAEALNRLQNDIVLDVIEKPSLLHLGSYSVEEIQAEREELVKLSKTLHLQLSTVIHSLEASNRDYVQRQLRERMKILRRVFGGEISTELRSIFPLDMIETSKAYLSQLRDSNDKFRGFISNLDESYGIAIEAKETRNTSKFVAAIKKMKQLGAKLLRREIMIGTTGKENQTENGAEGKEDGRKT